MPKDLLGNDLKKGDAVILANEVMPKTMVCKIEEISEGGLAVPNMPGVPKGMQAIQGGTIRLVFDWAVPFDPRQALGMVKVVKPEPTASA